MPVWWNRKSKWRRTAVEAMETGDTGENGTPQRPNDPIRGGVSNGFLSFESDGERKVVACHPLPKPTVALSGPSFMSRHNTGGSSGSSLGMDEKIVSAPGGYRSSIGTIATPIRGRDPTPSARTQKQPSTSISPIRDLSERQHNLQISPRRETQAHRHDNIPNDTIVGQHKPGSKNPSPRALEESNVPDFVANMIARQDAPQVLSLPSTIFAPPPFQSFESKWKKGKLIGRGTFGKVFAGFNRESGEICAIKEVEVSFDDENSRECLKQLSQEINLLGKLSHPNIVQYCGCELTDSTLSVYLEYVSGGSIRNLLREYGSFEEDVIRSYVAQIINGLAFLHGRNTLHRDIKGANILVDPNGVIKLADFGMAKTITSYTSVRSFRGSPYWMAPEVIMHSKEEGYGLSVDIWSLGCTIIEMATAKPPWSQCNGVQAIFKIGSSKEIPKIPDHLSDEGKNFLTLCLQRDPSRRATAAELMDHPFVRGKAKTKFYLGNPSSSNASSSNANSRPVIIDKSVSPIRNSDRLMRQQTEPRNHPSPRNENSLRTTLSLAIAPNSSPSRQHSNLTHQPPPPHGKNLSYPLPNTDRYTDSSQNQTSPRIWSDNYSPAIPLNTTSSMTMQHPPPTFSLQPIHQIFDA